MFSDEAGADEGFDDFGDAFPMGETSLTAQEPTAQEGLTEQLQNRPYATEVVDSRFGKAVDNLVNLLVLEGEYMPKATTAHTQQQELNQTSDAFQFPTNNLRTSGISQNARGIIRYSNQGTPVARAGSTHTEPVFSSALVGKSKYLNFTKLTLSSLRLLKGLNQHWEATHRSRLCF